MIHILDFDVRFTSSGLHYKSTQSFPEGLTAITGPNESGKSLVLELIRYCLFGTEALRAPLKEYSTLRASLVFEVKGRIYKVVRDKTGATLTTMQRMQEEETVLTTGTSTVNSSVVGLLGFPLAVFDTVLASLQDESQKLTEMTPTARKQMVDSLTGLVGIQDIVSECRSRSNASKNMAAGLKEAYVTPIEPYEPLGYRPSSDERKDLSVVRGLETKLAEAHRVMASPPDKPGDEPDVGMSSDDLSGQMYQQDIIIEELNELRIELASNPEPFHTMDELEVEADRIYISGLARKWPTPPLTLTEIDDMYIQWGRYHQMNRWHTLNKELTRLRDGLIQCPECSHQFSAESDQILMYEESLDELSHVDLSEDFGGLKDQSMLDQWKTQWEARPEHPKLDQPIIEPTLTQLELEHQLRLHRFDRGFVERKIERCESELDPAMKDRFARAVAQEKDHALWKAEKDRYQKWGIQSQQAQIDASILEKELLSYKNLAEIEADLETAIEYETLRATYRDLKERADILLERIESESQAQSDWKVASELVSQFSLEVKSYLLPSLSRVASSLISIITGGARNHVKVTDDFEILVDTQPVSTLSGSAKVAVNLALRVGLGQVLTSSTFPVFLADEVDASFDSERTESAIECIRNLTNTMRQVIIVSHKTVQDADHYIRMGDR